MKIDFVRHGKTKYNDLKTVTGWANPPLNEEGIEQAKHTATEIGTSYDEMYSSDLLRCKQTAEILNKQLMVPLFFDTRLRERNFGSLEGKTFEEMDPTLALKEKDKNQEYNYRPFGGESIEDVKQRVFSFISEMLKKRKDKKILVVTSGGVIRLLHKFLNKEVHEVIHNSSVHEFEFSEETTLN